jgi:hypothetical protein
MTTTQAIAITPAMSQAETDSKPPLNEEVEHAGLPGYGGYGDEVIMKSPFEELGFRKTLVVFRKATLMSLLAAFSASAE